MILRDFYCPKCETVKPDVTVGSIETRKFRAQCHECGYFGDFEIVCNGGLNSRYRFADFPSDPDYYRGQVKAGAVSIDGKTTIDNGDDRREARRDKIYYDKAKQRGTNPLTFDQKG